jgi:hypothetical protein
VAAGSDKADPRDRPLGGSGQRSQSLAIDWSERCCRTPISRNASLEGRHHLCAGFALCHAFEPRGNVPASGRVEPWNDRDHDASHERVQDDVGHRDPVTTDKGLTLQVVKFIEKPAFASSLFACCASGTGIRLPR